MTNKRLYTVKEFRDIVGLSQSAVYKHLADGIIPTVKIMKRVFIPSWYVDELTAKPIEPANAE